jgi:hypothetical protein
MESQWAFSNVDHDSVRWLNAMSFEYVGDCGFSDVVTNVGQCSLNPVVAPRRIFGSKANDGVDDFLTDARSIGPAFVAEVELLRHEFTVPTQDGVRGDNGGEFQQSFSTNRMCLYCE